MSTTSVPQAQRTPLYSVQVVLTLDDICSLQHFFKPCELCKVILAQIRINIRFRRILVVLTRVSGGFGSGGAIWCT